MRPAPPNHPATSPAYDVNETYQWNYDHGPRLDEQLLERVPARVRGDFSLCGIPLNSPLGVAAGPLLNHRWIAAYARLGFDFLTSPAQTSHRPRGAFSPIPRTVLGSHSVVWTRSPVFRFS